MYTIWLWPVLFVYCQYQLQWERRRDEGQIAHDIVLIKHVFTVDFGHFQCPNTEWKWLLSDMNDAADKRWRFTCLKLAIIDILSKQIS